MAEGESSNTLKRKVQEHFNVIRETKLGSLLGVANFNQSKCEAENMNARYCITDFDCCRLTEYNVNETVECEVCCVIKHKKTNTKYGCSFCKVGCCLECYDFHHKEKMLQSLRLFRQDCPENIDIRITDDAEFLTEKHEKEFHSCSDALLSMQNKTCTDDFSSVLDILSKKYGCNIELKFSKDKKMQCLYFQDRQMKHFFDSFPEYISIDLTCELVELELMLYTFVSEDSNGHCEITAACLINIEDAESILYMCNVFKEQNLNWKKIKIIHIDRQIKNENKDIIKESFTYAQVQICLFHAMKSLKNDLSMIDFSMTDKEKMTSLGLFEKMIYTVKESEYEDLYKQFKKLSTSFMFYFEIKWHRERKLWAIGLKFLSKTFFVPTSKFLYLMNKKFKNALNVEVCIENVIHNFFSILFSLRQERFKKVTSVFQTVPILTCAQNTYLRYAKFLTYYAAELVIHQLNISTDVRNIQKIAFGKYSIKSYSDILSVTINSCTCDFYRIALLPCCHIFAVRKLLSLPLFLEALCSLRWTTENYQNNFLVLFNIFKAFDETYDKNVAKNFQKCFESTGQLLPLLFEPSNDICNERCCIIQNLLTAWKHNIKIDVKVTENPLFSYENDKEMVFDMNFSIDALKELYGINAENIHDPDINFSSVPLCSEHSGDELSKYITC